MKITMTIFSPLLVHIPPSASNIKHSLPFGLHQIGLFNPLHISLSSFSSPPIIIALLMSFSSSYSAQKDCLREGRTSSQPGVRSFHRCSRCYIHRGPLKIKISWIPGEGAGPWTRPMIDNPAWKVFLLGDKLPIIMHWCFILRVGEGGRRGSTSINL